jgi:tryptophan synthase alpha subunit
VNKIYQAHTKMLVTTLGILDKHKVVWEAIDAFCVARNSLEQCIDAIRAEELKQSAQTTGITENKRVARREMCSAAAIVGGAVAAWADMQNNHELFQAVDFSAPDLMHKSEEDCHATCTTIWQAGVANLTAVADGQSLAQADLTDLKTKVDAFKTLLTKPRQARSNMKSATDILPEKIDAADRICERQLDRLMERFKESNRDFYGAYKVARVIVDFPTSQSTLTDAAAKAATTATTGTGTTAAK